MVLEDSTAKNPLVCGNHITDTIYEYTACLDIPHSVGKLTVVYKVHIYYAMTTIFVACVCLAFTSLWVYCMLGYSGK